MAKDPYRYFRIEARELIDGLGAGTLALEKGGGAEVVAQLLRLAHTLKGAARVVRQGDIADHAHALEDVLAPWRDGGQPPSREGIDACLRLVDRMRAGLAALDAPAPAAARGPAPAPGPVHILPVQPQAVRIETVETDAVVEGVTAVGRGLAELLQQLEPLQRSRYLALSLAGPAAPGRGAPGALADARTQARIAELGEGLHGIHQGLVAGVQRLQRELAEVRERANRMRLLPVSALFGQLERTARDAARALDREVGMECAGGAVALDAAVLDVLGEALQHVVRNAVSHGIEPTAERLAAGKPAAGLVRLQAERRGSQVVVTCHDDGRGIDLAAVRAAALRRDPSCAALLADDASTIGLLLRGGLSTSPTITAVAGRGVGLDVLRVAIERLGGAIELRSQPGRGTTFEMRVPVSLAAFPALLVEAGGAELAVPLEAVRCTLRVPAADVVRTAAGDSLLHERISLPFLPLAALLGIAAPAHAAQAAWQVVVLGVEGAWVALGVGRLLGTAEVAVRPLPAALAALPFLAGAALDEEGRPRLVLDAAGTLAAVRAGGAGAPAPAPAPRARLPILVIDDSLTTRTLEQSILESAGYEVDTAVSAEEGMAKAAQREYGLFMVDVEMPGMDGFTFVARTRADALLRRVPAILVTSRNAPEDRRRGEKVGASAYIVKSEFDQGHLLGLIRGLVG